MTGNLHAKLSSNSPNVNYIENYIFEWGKSSDGHMTYWNINLTTKVNEKIGKKPWRIEGRGPVVVLGGGLFLKQTEAWRAEKKFLRPPPPSLSQGLDDPAPSITWRSESATEKRQWRAKEGMDELNSRSSKCPRSGYFQDKWGKKKMSIPLLGKNEALKTVIYNC